MSDSARGEDVESVIAAWTADAASRNTSAGHEADPEILDSFVAECLDLLEEAEQAILRLESAPDDDSVAVSFRCFHTIKGTASFLSLDHVSGVAHDAETLLSGIRDGGGLSAETASLLIRSIDVLASCVRHARDGNDVPAEVEPLQQALRAAASGATAAGEPRPVPTVAADSIDQVREERAVHAESWTRVRTDRLDRLLEAVGELLVTQSMLSREASAAVESSAPLAQLVATAGKNIRELQQLCVGMRLVPLRSLFRRMERVVHDLSRRSGKPVRLVTRGEDTEIDRNLIEDLSDPLLHMLRNAVGHGIELAAEREAAGKPPVATLTLEASSRSGNVQLRLSDDGRGISIPRVRERAIQRGLLAPERGGADAEVIDFIFSPGFSTAEIVTELSGRGVGLDVVRRNLQALHGRVSVSSETGRGCTFVIDVPLTLAVTDAMVVRVGDERFLLPVSNMMHSFQPGADGIRSVAAGCEVAVLADGVVPLIRLDRRLGTSPVRAAERSMIVVVADGERRGALLVDQLMGQQQVVSKPLNDMLGRPPGVSASAILGDGRVGLILDVSALLDHTL